MRNQFVVEQLNGGLNAGWKPPAWMNLNAHSWDLIDPNKTLQPHDKPERDRIINEFNRAFFSAWQQVNKIAPNFGYGSV
jgi:hypothetical protein